MKNGHQALFAIALLTALTFSCSKKPAPLHGRVYNGQLFGKPYVIDVVGDTTDYEAGIDSIVNAYESNFDLNDPNSILSRYNAYQRTDSMFAFNDSTRAFGIVYDLCRDLNFRTLQYYDPTMGPLKRAWLVANSGGMVEPNLDSLYQFVGFDGAKMDLVEMNEGNYQYKESLMRKADPRIEADFTILAAAVALDQVGDFLEEKLNSRKKATTPGQYRIKYGRDVITYGSGVDELNVIPLGISPDSGDQYIRMQNRAFSFRNTADKVLLVDPTYGYPVENEMVYVAVSAPSLAEATVFSEAFITMGLEKAKEYYTRNEESDIQSFMFYSDQQVVRSASTEGFDMLLIIPDSSATKTE